MQKKNHNKNLRKKYKNIKFRKIEGVFVVKVENYTLYRGVNTWMSALNFFKLLNFSTGNAHVKQPSLGCTALIQLH